MPQHQDQIYDTYFSEMGSPGRKAARERIHWIIEQVHGTSVLDVGCSQGLLSILLGREGKRVTGLDVSSNAIDAANLNLRKEEIDLKNHVTYEHKNYFHYHNTPSYDTVILGHILEEVVDVSSFFDNAFACLKEGGRIVVTVPLGFTDSPDQKRAFYLNDLLSLKKHSMGIENIEYSNHWIGIVYTNNPSANHENDHVEWLERMEAAMISKENEFYKTQGDLKMQIKSLEEHLEIAEVQNQEQQTRLKQQQSIKKDFLEEKNNKVNIQKELYDVYNEQEKVINDYHKLSDKHEKVRTRYDNLRNSKLGKLTIKYWKLRRRKRRQ